jgi:heme-degrading monooxygenase HmoA
MGDVSASMDDEKAERFSTDKEGVMRTRIARTWRGRTRAADADAYAAYLEETGVRALRATPGNERVLILRRVDGDEAEFWVISLWRDMASISAFAGADPTRARYFPEDERYLLEMTPDVIHYDVAVDES